jgi:hypothetical protein
MKKQHILYLGAGIVFLILIAGGWYTYRYRECAKMINYIPPREGKDAGSGFYGAVHSLDKGDYYILGNYELRKFKTSEDAMRACIWK